MKTPTQQDIKERTVSLENLKAMCQFISGVAHRFSVTQVSRSRVHVEYSNPDEYGGPHPVSAIFPCYPGPSPENPTIVLDALRYAGGEEVWQSFQELYDCPSLWRDPYDQLWKTHSQVDCSNMILEQDSCVSCVVCDLPLLRASVKRSMQEELPKLPGIDMNNIDEGDCFDLVGRTTDTFLIIKERYDWLFEVAREVIKEQSKA